MFTASVFFLSCGVMLGRYNKNTASAAELIKKPAESTESENQTNGFKNAGRNPTPTPVETEPETETEAETKTPSESEADVKSETKPETKPETKSEPETAKPETEPETKSKPETEPEPETEAPPETKAQPASEPKPAPESGTASAQPDSTAQTPTERLYDLYKNKAPLKWARNSAGQFVLVYPELSFAYYDIDSGESLTYNSSEIRYSASLIKAPYIYSVFEEIDAYLSGEHRRDKDGNIVFAKGEEKYNLAEKWKYNSATMLEEGSGEIMNKEDGFELSWRELFDYALLYSDNVAFRQIRNRFGYDSFNKKAVELGIKGTSTGFMNLSADDCVLFLREMYDYFKSGTELALHMKECMMTSKHLEMICSCYPANTAAHKYGWDIGAFHDMAIVFDEHPYIIVIMTDYEDGGQAPTDFMKATVELIKEIHAEKYADSKDENTESAN